MDREGPRVRKMRSQKSDPKRSEQAKRETLARRKKRRAKHSNPSTWNETTTGWGRN